MNNKQFVGGFVSVKSILEGNSREIYQIYFEKDRYHNVMESKFHAAEKRQYEYIERSGAKTAFVSKEEFDSIVDGTTTGGIAAEVGPRRFISLDTLLQTKSGYYTILDGIEDPFNFGYALRALYAAGVDGVILPKRNFFTATETVARASAGASELMPCCEMDNLVDACKEMKARGIRIISTAKTEKAKDVFRTNFHRPVCMVYGGEKRGISAEVLDQCDMTVKIKYPRNCHYSLPACSAISIIAFEVAKKMSYR